MSKVTVWYDGACPLCAREIALMRRLDWRMRIDFVDLVDETKSCPIGRSVALARFHVLEHGKILSGAAAFGAMWRVIPLFYPLGLLARNRTVLQGLEWLYLLFLKARPAIQRTMQGKFQ
jgi:predicted DCC family thiol-disulfide oxidoreductase YuxK